VVTTDFLPKFQGWGMTMLKRRDFLKSAAAVAGAGLLRPVSALASRVPPDDQSIIDFETFLPREFDGKPFGPEGLTALADEAGVGRFIVFPETTTRPDNQGLAKRIRSYPRLIGCASVNPALGGGEAARELEMSVKDLGLRGVRLSPTLHNYPLDAEIVLPVLAKARDLRVPVTIDGDSENCKPSQIAAIALKFPEVAIIMDMGFRAPVRPPGEPAGKEMIEVVAKCPNLHLGLTALTTCQPAYLMSTIWAGGPERVVFGSNAPSGIPLFAVKGIRWVGLGRDAEALIFRENLKKIYRLG
jgi:predicted TIM-barrel fold metal-dependent hydrolase